MSLTCTLVATGSLMDEAGVPALLGVFKAEGVVVKHDAHLYEYHSAEARADKLIAAMSDSGNNVIWSVRGGEGSADLLPFVIPKLEMLKAHKPKCLVGFSDFTPILNVVAQHLGWPVLHGPAALQLVQAKLDQSSHGLVWNVVQGKARQWALSNLTPMNDAAKKVGEIKARAVGGNMSLLNISVGDSWALDVKDKILFIEDWQEKPHVVARTLKYFGRLGWFNDAKAVVLGDFGFLKPGAQDTEAHHAGLAKVLQRFADSVDIPVLSNGAFGHGEHNECIAMHSVSTLTLGDAPSWSFSL
jgi:muramoyltetrapeptide carboxypeptidase